MLVPLTTWPLTHGRRANLTFWTRSHAPVPDSDDSGPRGTFTRSEIIFATCAPRKGTRTDEVACQRCHHVFPTLQILSLLEVEGARKRIPHELKARLEAQIVKPVNQSVQGAEVEQWGAILCVEAEER